MSVIDGRQVLRHGAFSLVVGIVGAAASVVLCLVVNGAFDLLRRFPMLLLGLPLFAWASLALYRWHGVPLDTTTRSVARRIREDETISPWLAPDILLGTALSILGGASVGKEAGALHMGASLGQLVARPFHLRSVYRSDAACGEGQTGMNAYAASAGMAATFAALFFAPLGSAAFVMELTGYRRDVVRHLPTLLLGCAVAWAGASFVGVGDVIPKVALPAITWRVAGACVLVGAVAGVAGGLFGSAIDHVQRATERIRRNYFLWAVAGSVLFVALVLGAGWQTFEGTGAVQLTDALGGHAGVWDFAIKALLTVLCLGFWLRGGEIMPTFTVGALLGVSCTAMTGGEAGVSAALGLVAFFCAMSRCPLAAFLMGCEIFGWEGAPLFALAVATAYLVRRGEGYYALGATSLVRDALGRRRVQRSAATRPAAQSEGRSAGADAVCDRRSTQLVDEAARLVRAKAAEVEEELETHGDDATK